MIKISDVINNIKKVRVGEVDFSSFIDQLPKHHINNSTVVDIHNMKNMKVVNTVISELSEEKSI